jgi:hypothetical protein
MFLNIFLRAQTFALFFRIRTDKAQAFFVDLREKI